MEVDVTIYSISFKNECKIIKMKIDPCISGNKRKNKSLFIHKFYRCSYRSESVITFFPLSLLFLFWLWITDEMFYLHILALTSLPPICFFQSLRFLFFILIPFPEWTLKSFRQIHFVVTNVNEFNQWSNMTNRCNMQNSIFVSNMNIRDYEFQCELFIAGLHFNARIN